MKKHRSLGLLALPACLSAGIAALALGYLLAQGSSWEALVTLVVAHDPLTRSRTILLLLSPATALAAVLDQRRTAAAVPLENEERFRSLAEAATDATFILVDGRIVFANPPALKLLGATTHNP